MTNTSKSRVKISFLHSASKQSFHDAALKNKGLKHLQCYSKRLGTSFAQGIEFFDRDCMSQLLPLARDIVFSGLPEQEKSISGLGIIIT